MSEITPYWYDMCFTKLEKLLSIRIRIMDMMDAMDEFSKLRTKKEKANDEDWMPPDEDDDGKSGVGPEDEARNCLLWMRKILDDMIHTEMKQQEARIGGASG